MASQQHDFAGLQRQLEKINDLEPLFLGLKAFRETHGAHLTPYQQEQIGAAYRAMAFAFDSLVQGNAPQEKHDAHLG